MLQFENPIFNFGVWVRVEFARWRRGDMVRPCGRSMWMVGETGGGGGGERRSKERTICVDSGDQDTPESTFLKHCYLEAVSVHGP